MSTKVVTAAAGARDQYQIPLALQEAGLLASHITDQYSPDALLALLDRIPGLLPPQLLAKLHKRHHSGLPSARVHCSRSLALRLATSQLLPAGGSLRARLQNDQMPIGRSALAAARRSSSNQAPAALLLYAGYAHSAFSAEPRSARRRGLVQYHPHISRSAEILRADIARYPCLSDSLSHLAADERDPTNLSELELADLVLCCSSFTAATCRAVGVPQAKLRVIPYGIDLPTASPPPAGAAAAAGATCRFLFVGTGIHRKGLHHLLLAWRQAALRHSELWIVSRRVDREIREHFDPGPNVTWRHDVSDQELETIYASKPVFVLPSLIEGFGYVFLEALARGCYCIGTANTALPDLLAGSRGCGAVVEAGAIEALAEALRQAEEQHHGGRLDCAAITAQARRFPWSRFRQGVVELVRQELLG